MAADESRVNRLIGGEVGGGLPLPLAFSAVTRTLLDDGVASFTELVSVIEKSMAFKEARVLSTAWRTWEDFSRDILEQMKAQRVIDGTDDGVTYWVSQWFSPGVRQVVIPDADIGFTEWDRKTREKRDRNSALLMDLRALMGKYEDADAEALLLLREAEYRLNLLVTPPDAERKRREGVPPEKRRRLRKGMSGYFREFWETAPAGGWFTVMEILQKWSAEHPEQPPAGTHDVGGAMRKAAREMVDAGVIQERTVLGTDSIGRPASRKYYSKA